MSNNEIVFVDFNDIAETLKEFNKLVDLNAEKVANAFIDKKVIHVVCERPDFQGYNKETLAKVACLQALHKSIFYAENLRYDEKENKIYATVRGAWGVDINIICEMLDNKTSKLKPRLCIDLNDKTVVLKDIICVDILTTI